MSGQKPPESPKAAPEMTALRAVDPEIASSFAVEDEAPATIRFG